MKSSNVAAVVAGAQAAPHDPLDGGEDAPAEAGRWQILFSALVVPDIPVREARVPA